MEEHEEHEEQGLEFDFQLYYTLETPDEELDYDSVEWHHETFMGITGVDIKEGTLYLESGPNYSYTFKPRFWLYAVTLTPHDLNDVEEGVYINPDTAEKAYVYSLSLLDHLEPLKFVYNRLYKLNGGFMGAYIDMVDDNYMTKALTIISEEFALVNWNTRGMFGGIDIKT